jgi:hypothetical protein
MGYQHHAESESPTQFAEHPGIKSATEQASIKRNNTNEMLPENSSGKDDEIIKMIHSISIEKQGEEPNNHGRATTETLEYTGTDKLDPTIGSIREIKQERSLTVGSEPIRTTQSLSKLNRDGRLSPTDKKEHCGIKQADKGRDSQETPRHPINNTVNTTWIDRHTTKSKVPFNSIVAAIALTAIMVSIYELSVMDISMSNMTSLPETTQKLPDTDIILGHTSFNLAVLVMATVLTVVSLGLRRHGTIACQLQEQLIWPHDVCSMNSLSCLARSLSRSLGPQDLRKGENEDTNDTTKDQRSTPSELNCKQAVPDKPDTIRFKKVAS